MGGAMTAIEQLFRGQPGNLQIHLIERLGRGDEQGLAIGAAEEVTADGLEPEAVFGGMFVQLAPGNYRVLARRKEGHIALAFLPGERGDNGFAGLVRI